MKKYILLSLVALLGLYSCSDNDSIEAGITPDIKVESVDGKESVVIGQSVLLKAVIDESLSDKDYEYTWKVNNEPVQDNELINDDELTFNFTPSEVGEFKIVFELQYLESKYAAEINISALGKFENGVYILDEGRMGEHGSLHFITSSNEFINDAYFAVNQRYLGGSTQDLFIYNGKLYIIAQNGSTNDLMDGLLTISDSQTLERIDSFQSELSQLSWPTNIVVLNEQNILIRDDAGVYRFNLDTKELTYINGTRGAIKRRMTVLNGQAFVAANKSLLVLEADKNEVSKTISFDNAISSVIPAYDGNLWIAEGSNTIVHFDATTLTAIDSKQLSEGSFESEFAITPTISAYNEYIYYSGLDPLIYMFNYNTGENILVADLGDYNSDTVVYQTVQVNPKTGDAYMTSLKSFDEYMFNHVTVFSFDNGKLKFKDAHKDHLAFPAGVFFTDSFN